jgi:hypothetical protein
MFAWGASPYDDPIPPTTPPARPFPAAPGYLVHAGQRGDGLDPDPYAPPPAATVRRGWRWRFTPPTLHAMMVRRVWCALGAAACITLPVLAGLVRR